MSANFMSVRSSMSVPTNFAQILAARVVVGAIAQREAAMALRTLGVYLALSVALLAAAWLLLVDVRALRTAGLLVREYPFSGPVDIAVLIIGLFFAVTAAAAIARDRESGTLEVLFYGPVDELTYIFGKVGGLVLAYLAILPLTAFAFWLLAWISGFVLSAAAGASLLISIFPVAEIIAFGVLLAIGTNRIRTAVLLLVGVTMVFLGVSAAYDIVRMIPIDNASSPILPLREALASVDGVLRWLSPFAYLERIVHGVAINAWRSVAIGLALTLLYTAAIVAAAAAWLRHRGVQRSGE